MQPLEKEVLPLRSLLYDEKAIEVGEKTYEAYEQSNARNFIRYSLVPMKDQKVSISNL